MHRIMSMRGAAVNNFKRLTIQKCSCAEHRLVWTATLGRQELLANKFKIQQIGQVECIRTQSTTPSADVASRKRKRRKFRGSRFVELLQVTDNATKQTKTKVGKLKAGNLSNFVLTSNLPPSKKAKKRESSKDEVNYQPVEYQRVNLEVLDNTAVLQSEFYDERPLVFFGKEVKGIKAIEVSEILKSFNNFKEIIETIKDEYSEEMDYRGNKILDEDKIEEREDDLEAVIETIEAEPVKSKSKQKKNTKKEKQERYKSKYHVSQEQEKLAKHKSLQVNLNSYLNVCVSVGSVSRGFSVLLLYRQKYQKAGLDVRWFGIEPYNILLKGYAETGNYDKIREICGILKEDGIAKNHQTFAAIFECLGRSEPTENNIKLIQKYKEKAENMGISMNDIVDKSEFQFDQREMVLDAIQRVEPNFEPNYTPPKLTYSNRLLEQLNEYVEGSRTPNLDKDEGRKIMNSKKGFTKNQLQQYARQQLRIELEGSLTVKSVEDNTDAGPHAEQSKQKWEQLQKEWRNTICMAINRDMTILKAQSKYKPQSYMTFFTYLKTVKPELYADILLNEIRMLAEGSETYSPTVNQLYRALGQRVYAKFQIERKKNNGVLEKVGEIYAQYCERWEECDTSDNPRQMWQRIVHDNQHWGPTMNIEEKPWPNSALLGVGRFLYNILMRDIKIDSNITKVQNKNKQRNNLLPAFYTLFRNQGKNVKEEVKPHPILSKLLRSSRQKTLTFDANMVPMLCPPQPWSTPVNGGYLLTNSDLIRLPQQAVQQWSRIKSSNYQDLYPALDSLNQLASIPWRVNKDILDVVLEVFKKGGNDKLDVPQPPSSLPPLPSAFEKNSDMTNNERFQMFRQKMIHKRRQAEMYSLWCDTLYRLSLANHYRDKVFWLPHNMDFRGRVYPVPPHLNHLGSDLARSMLVFDQAQPLGTDGFSWLKLHCINLTGFKKRDSIRERLLYAEEIMDDIIDSAENPLTGRKWWTTSDEPWQTLACCIEIAKVRKCPEPEKYMCRLPIHQDGSCNGLQHYAALGRDKTGAISVNLAPSATPQDVYSAVAALVEKTRENDAENGLHVAQILNGYVRRKVIKQTVMTTVYGVTRYGARLQIAKQLKDIEEFPKEWVWPASTYLTTKTFESLREMFTSTKEIQDWFTECARMISAVCGQNVEWVTPLGLPVVQPYSRYDPKKVSAMSGTKIKERVHMDMYERPNVMKQKNAFPPNFIHSLDSSHMMLTSLYCERKGITFVSVHDCFWTHACTVPDMNKICREQFVALHSEPILEGLSKFLTQKYSFKEKDLANNGSAGDLTKQKLNKLLETLPNKGNFDLENVLNSVYFFS